MVTAHVHVLKVVTAQTRNAKGIVVCVKSERSQGPCEVCIQVTAELQLNPNFCATTRSRVEWCKIEHLARLVKNAVKTFSNRNNCSFDETASEECNLEQDRRMLAPTGRAPSQTHLSISILVQIYSQVPFVVSCQYFRSCSRLIQIIQELLQSLNEHLPVDAGAHVELLQPQQPCFWILDDRRVAFNVM